MLNSHIGRLRLIGMLEGISWILLLFIAVPLKHLGDKPMAVKIIGPIHGGLFILFCIALYRAMDAHGWSVKKSLRPFLAALVPFGPFVIDRGLKQEQEAQENRCP